jgi:hypothetical protein
VIERAIWRSDVVRFGRVPRSTVHRPPAPAGSKPKPHPKKPVASGGKTKGRPVPASWKSSLGPIHTRFALLARRVVGRPSGRRGFTSERLLQWAWHGAAKVTLPLSLARVSRRVERISRRHLTPGDLILYGTHHVGIYVGGGRMVDVSKRKGRVVLRKVFRGADRRYVRLHTWS